MARFVGRVGYAVTSETSPDVYQDTIKERRYYGRILNETSSHREDDKVNSDLSLSSRISVVADAYAFEHFSNIKYVVDSAGVYWDVTSVQLSRPRLILSTGGVYDGIKPKPEDQA